MKHKTKVLAVLALLGTSLILAGCPHHHRRPHIPHPHHLSQSLVPLDYSVVMTISLQTG